VNTIRTYTNVAWRRGGRGHSFRGKSSLYHDYNIEVNDIVRLVLFYTIVQWIAVTILYYIIIEMKITQKRHNGTFRIVRPVSCTLYIIMVAREGCALWCTYLHTAIIYIQYNIIMHDTTCTPMCVILGMILLYCCGYDYCCR